MGTTIPDRIIRNNNYRDNEWFKNNKIPVPENWKQIGTNFSSAVFPVWSNKIPIAQAGLYQQQYIKAMKQEQGEKGSRERTISQKTKKTKKRKRTNNELGGPRVFSVFDKAEATIRQSPRSPLLKSSTEELSKKINELENLLCNKGTGKKRKKKGGRRTRRKSRRRTRRKRYKKKRTKKKSRRR